MKESDNAKNLDSIVIFQARRGHKSLFCVSTPKETEDMHVSLPCIGQAVHYRFFPTRFRLHSGRRKGLEYKAYPAMDLFVHGDPDDVCCNLIEDCICKL